MNYLQVFEAAATAMLTSGFLLVCVGVGMAALRLRRAVTAPAEGAPELFATSRRVFLAGFLVLGATIALGAAISTYYIPD